MPVRIETHSGAFAGFICKKLTADDLGAGCKPDKSTGCKMTGCKGKCMTGHEASDDASSTYEKLEISDLVKNCVCSASQPACPARRTAACPARPAAPATYLFAGKRGLTSRSRVSQFDMQYADGEVNPDELEWNACSKGHVWGQGSISTSLCGHLGWMIDGNDY